MRYKLHTTPYVHQAQALKLLMKKGSLGLLMDPGCGKTKTTIDYIGYLACRQKGLKVLVIAPKTVLGVWEDEVPIHLHPMVECKIVRLEGRKRAKVLQANLYNKEATIFLVSYDSAWRTEGLLKSDINLMICDESHYIKNPTSRRSKFIHKMGLKSELRMILTGTFLPNGVLGAYSQMKFLNPNEFDMSWTVYKERYMRWWKPKGQQYKIPKGPRRTKELNKKIMRNVFKVEKDKVLDLPERTDVIVPIEMPPKAWKYYRQMEKDKIIKFEGGKAKAEIVLTELLHFQQITGGFVRIDTGKFDERDRPIKEDVFIHDAKLKALEEIIDVHKEYGEKVIVFCRYRWELKKIGELLTKRKITHEEISGSSKDRDGVRRRFQSGDTEVLVLQIASGGIGITLTRGNIVVFYSTDQHLDHYLQARDRVHRPGQTRKVTYYHLIVKGSIDEKIRESHQEKKSLADMITAKNWRNFI